MCRENGISFLEEAVGQMYKKAKRTPKTTYQVTVFLHLEVSRLSIVEIKPSIVAEAIIKTKDFTFKMAYL
jgi:hypothetical protein